MKGGVVERPFGTKTSHPRSTNFIGAARRSCHTMKKLISPLHLVAVFLFLWIAACNGEMNGSCIESERHALLKLKKSLIDPHQLLSSWSTNNCCRWKGVACDGRTSHVVSLDLRYSHLYDGISKDWRLGGELNPSLLELPQLNYLDLSSNDFRGSQIPSFISSITTLRYLNLSNAGFRGVVPHQLGNLSSLRFLDLNSFDSIHDLRADSLQWLSRLTGLQYLDLSRVDLSGAVDLFDALNMLPSLSVLILGHCQLQNIVPLSMSHVNLTSVATIDLQGNQINSTFPSWVFNVSSLTNLNLQLNHFHGPVPDAFDKLVSLEELKLGVNAFSGVMPGSIKSLCNLHTLDLSTNEMEGEAEILGEILSGCVADRIEALNLRSNKLRGNLSAWLGKLKRITLLDLRRNLLSGPVPASLGRLSTLTNLYLSHNEFNGTLPASIGQLSNLVIFDISFNSLEGVVSEAHLANLTSLKGVSMSSNSLVLNVSSDWIAPFHLEAISFSSCQIGPKFPAWFRTQTDYATLDLSRTGIVDVLPDWFWTLSDRMLILDLSYNTITGKLPAHLKFTSMHMINLNSNKFAGVLVPLPSDIEYVDFSNNSFSGSILPIINEDLPILADLILSNNHFDGMIPDSICKFQELEVLDLSSNHFSGQIPACWPATGHLQVLNLANNNLTGQIPDNLGSLSWLQSLQLGNNHLSGTIPLALRDCEDFLIIDLGGNELSGSIPSWIGESLPHLHILRLRSNKFEGAIPEELSYLSGLQILDLGDNNLSGVIPKGFGNFTTMVAIHKAGENILDSVRNSVLQSIGNFGPWGYIESLHVITKGRELEYSKNLQFVASVDLSDNKLSGEIPLQLADLYGLQNLNLSGNYLSGRIPNNISALRFLESLDLSRNNLSGDIPASMSAMTSLSHLNLSYNSLSGRIPSGNQFDTLNDASIYVGNRGLCGPPLEECPRNDTIFSSILHCQVADDDCESENLWLYLGGVFGFILGFWAVCGALFFCERWRNASFRFVDCLNH